VPSVLRKSIAIIGFMGAGKSTVGRILASKLRVGFFDLDEMIVGRTGKSIVEIFEIEGESCFRRYEQEELIRQSSLPAKVLACGGGIILAEENVKVLRDNFYVFYLEISEEEAVRRLSQESGRPLLEGKNVAKTVTHLMEQRSQRYSRTADEIVKANDRTADEIAEEIFEKCKKSMFKPHGDATRS
jgi:shikimate kinase